MEVSINPELNVLTIKIPFDAKGKPSSTKRTMLHASSGGNQETEIKLGDKVLKVGVNAFTNI